MDRTIIVAFAAAGIAGGSMWGWSALGHGDALRDVTSADPPAAVSREPILPVPAVPELPPAQVALGKRLFFERALSADGSMACHDCHDLGHGGADQRPVVVGIHGRIGTLNTPTVWNADLNVKQFWDGHADTLESQIDGPLLDPSEMGAMWPAILEKLRGEPTYVTAFGAAGISPTTVREALATYERTLVTPGSRFDRWLGGNEGAITTQEREGYASFKRYGCISCHQGRNVGGNMFETLGIMGDYFADRGTPIVDTDLGRYNVTKRPEDRYRFRVPSLRVVTLTAPYFHDGKIPNLEQAIVAMGKYQLGIQIPSPDVATIAAFLGSLAPDP